MDKDQILAQINHILGTSLAQELPVTLNIYFVESMIVGPGDFRHVVTQTTTLSPRTSLGAASQSVSIGHQTSGGAPGMDVQEETEAGEMMGIGELASAAVVLLASKAVEAVGGEAGKRLIGDLWDKIRAKLTGRDALADFEASPDDADAQAALRLQLKKVLEAEPAFRAEVAELVEDIKAKGGDHIIQTANVTGDQNVTTQIAGSGNVVR